MSELFAKRLNEHFPGAMSEAEFVSRSKAALADRFDFRPTNALASVCLCRDELCTPLAQRVAEAWGESFNMRSLAGMLWIGRTGFGALHSHAPKVDDRERHVFFVMPHIGIGEDGQIGQTVRRGQSEPSAACGALVAFKNELDSGHINVLLDRTDIEQSLLRQRLLMEWDFRSEPTLEMLTRLALSAAVEDLCELVKDGLDPAIHDYAILSGIQIHGPQNESFVWPDRCYAVIDGNRIELEF